MKSHVIGLVAVTAAAALVADAIAQDSPGFGDDESVAFAEQLWQVLGENDYVGENAIRRHAYPGSQPHGAVLEQIEGVVSVNGQSGTTIVKTNFAGEGITPAAVMSSSRSEFLGPITVMFKRDAGYAPDSGDWFWAKHLPGGELDQTPDGAPLAGRVAGCIGCHGDAAGGDFVFLHDRYSSE